jgi:hypothetical protein
MSAGTTIGYVLIGFLVYVFAKGELSSYIALFKKSGTSGAVSGSGESPQSSGLPSLTSIIGNLSGE